MQHFVNFARSDYLIDDSLAKKENRYQPNTWNWHSQNERNLMDTLDEKYNSRYRVDYQNPEENMEYIARAEDGNSYIYDPDGQFLRKEKNKFAEKDKRPTFAKDRVDDEEFYQQRGGRLTLKQIEYLKSKNQYNSYVP